MVSPRGGHFCLNLILHTTYYILHTTYYRLQTTDYRLQTTDYRLHTTYYILHTTYYILHTTDYRLQTTDYRLQTTDDRLQTTDYRLQTYSHVPWSSSWRLVMVIPHCLSSYLAWKNTLSGKSHCCMVMFPLALFHLKSQVCCRGLVHLQNS